MTIDYGPMTTDDLLSTVRELPIVDLRLMLHRTSDGLILHTSVGNAAPDSANQATFHYDYGEFMFAGVLVSGAELAAWFSAGKAEVGQLTFQVPTIGNASASRYTSRAPRKGRPFPWPRRTFQIYSPERVDLTYPPRVLSAPGQPFFPDLVSATDALLFDSWPDPSRSSMSSELLALHIADTRAWLKSVSVSPTSIIVDAVGTDIASVELTVTNGPQHYEQILGGPEEVRVPIAYDEAASLWIALIGRDGWTDHREIRGEWQGPSFDLVTFTSDEFAEVVDRLRLGGESERVEFKQLLPRRDRDLVKTVAAFANSFGGAILIGVSKPGELAGLDLATVADLKDQIESLIAGNLNPLPPYKVLECELDHRSIIVVRIDAGPDWPYAVGQTHPEFYVRRGATTWRAQPEDVRALAQLRLSGSERARPLFWPRT